MASSDEIAAALEELHAPLVEIINQLRMGQPEALEYALLYDFRWRVGRVLDMAKGEGVPNGKWRRRASEIIEAQMPPL